MSSRASSIDLTTPTKRHAAHRVLHSLSSRIERNASKAAEPDQLLTTLLHPLTPPGEAPVDVDNTALKEVTAKLRQQTGAARKWYIIDPRVCFGGT